MELRSFRDMWPARSGAHRRTSEPALIHKHWIWAQPHHRSRLSDTALCCPAAGLRWRKGHRGHRSFCCPGVYSEKRKLLNQSNSEILPKTLLCGEGRWELIPKCDSEIIMYTWGGKKKHAKSCSSWSAVACHCGSTLKSTFLYLTYRYTAYVLLLKGPDLPTALMALKISFLFRLKIYGGRFDLWWFTNVCASWYTDICDIIYRMS